MSMASRMLLMSSVFISRPLALVLVSALILIRRDLGMVKVGGGGGQVGGGRGIDVGSLLASEMWLRFKKSNAPCCPVCPQSEM